MHCPLEVLIQRDVKGLYKKALAGEIAQFTGISDVYETPLKPEVTIDSSREMPELSVAVVLRRLEELGFIPPTGAGISSGQGLGELEDSSTEMMRSEGALTFDI